MKSISFETKVWEKDWRFILQGEYLMQMIDSCKQQFLKKHLIVNNVINRKALEKRCEELVKLGIIDEVYFVSDFAEKVLEKYEINKNSFNGGYYYSIAELVGIHVCQTEYLLHFSGDSIMIKNDGLWVSEAMNQMETNKNIIVANALWHGGYECAKNESKSENESFFIGEGFSDQCYLIRKSDFDRPIYNEKNPISERYPKYGGELFEKRIDAYMRNNNLSRLTHKFDVYLHDNFPKGFIANLMSPKSIVHQRTRKINNLKQNQ